MSPGRQAMISAHLTKEGGFTKSDCSHVLVEQAMGYSVAQNCETKGAADLRSKLRATCFADVISTAVHSPLCQTRAMYTTSQLVGFYLTVVATIAVLTEWAVYPLPPGSVSRGL